MMGPYAVDCFVVGNPADDLGFPSNTYYCYTEKELADCVLDMIKKFGKIEIKPQGESHGQAPQGYYEMMQQLAWKEKFDP